MLTTKSLRKIALASLAFTLILWLITLFTAIFARPLLYEFDNAASTILGYSFWLIVAASLILFVFAPSHEDLQTNKSFLQELKLIAFFPIILIWDLFIIIASISLLIAWLSFVFGSVLGVILLLIFYPSGFLLPLALLNFLAHPWPDE